MATVIPSYTNTSAHDGERQTLEQLRCELPDDYVVFHNIDWMHRGTHKFENGEIDFIVMAPSGKLLLIEQKNGFIDEVDGDLQKHYEDKDKSIVAQMRRSYWGLTQRLKDTMGSTYVFVESILFCPDHDIVHVPAKLALQAIVDKSQAKHLSDIVRKILGEYDEDTGKCERITQFLAGELSLVISPTSSSQLNQNLYVHDADRLYEHFANWQVHPYRVRVTGGAGSGKTYLAERHFAACIAASKTPLYVCFNRPLAEMMKARMPSGGVVSNVHQLLYQALPWPANTKHDNNSFDAYFLNASSTPHAFHQHFDAIIVDEGQDITKPAWQFITSCLKPDASLLWLEDSDQALFTSAQTQIDFTATVALDANYRNPQKIAKHAQLLTGIHKELVSRNPIAGEEPKYHPLKKGEAMTDERLQSLLSERIQSALDAGFSYDEMVILSLRSKAKSSCTELENIGGHPLKHFSSVDADSGLSQFIGDGILCDSVLRFKGCQAAVVFVVDSETTAWTEAFSRRLYCAMTRSVGRLEVFLDSQTEELMMARL